MAELTGLTNGVIQQGLMVRGGVGKADLADALRFRRELQEAPQQSPPKRKRAARKAVK